MLSQSPNPLATPAEKSAPPSKVAPIPPASPSEGACGTWTEAPARKSAASFDPDGSTVIRIRDAMQKLRRAELTRIVKGVVVASTVICLAAIVRFGIDKASGDPPEVTHQARMILHGYEVGATFRTMHDGEPLALAKARPPKHRAKHGGGRVSASRSHHG